MAQKTRAELLIQNNALITTNANQEITGAILNGHLVDILDSVRMEDGSSATGTVRVRTITTGITPVATDTGVVITQTPKGEVTVQVNGVESNVGSTREFYFKSPAGIVRAAGEITFGDELHYDSTKLGYTLDTGDEVALIYIIVN